MEFNENKYYMANPEMKAVYLFRFILYLYYSLLQIN
jgi:hypothetical protein